MRYSLLTVAIPLALALGACITEVPENPPGVLRVVEHSLTCAPPETCEEPTCGRGREVVDGPCCDECGNLEGEPCGGLWGTAGTCNPGLDCDLPPVEDDGGIVVDPVGTCVDRCGDFYYETCHTDSDCDPGYGCGAPTSECTPSSCFCDPETGDVGACTRDCLTGVGLCEPLGGEGDPCGVWALPACDEGLSCLGGFPPADQPGTCAVAPVCSRTRFAARCRGDYVYAGGRMMPRHAGELVLVEIDGVEYQARVRTDGSFLLRAPVPDGRFEVNLVGCERVHAVRLSCSAP
jgi:hypothetical protein